MTAKTIYVLLLRFSVYGVGVGVFAVLWSSGISKWPSVAIAIVAAAFVALLSYLVRTRIEKASGKSLQ